MVNENIQTPLSEQELAHFRDLLLARREMILGTYKDLLTDVQEKNLPDGSGAQSNMPTHQADLALDDELNDENTQMAEHERDLLVEIDEALRRIEDKTYGVCQGTGSPIEKPRLEAKPWTRYSFDYVRQAHPHEK